MNIESFGVDFLLEDYLKPNLYISRKNIYIYVVMLLNGQFNHQEKMMKSHKNQVLIVLSTIKMRFTILYL